MAAPALFVGVVSYAGSRFAVNQGEDGLGSRIAHAIDGSVLRVNTADLLADDAAASAGLTPAAVRAALTAELRAEFDWGKFLGRTSDPRWWATQGLRWAHRGWQQVRTPSPAMLRRLLNIELSHLDLMRAGLSSGSPWILVLEDDASAPDPDDLTAGLMGLMSSSEPIAFANLSQSFSTRELGIDHLLAPDPMLAWSGRRAREILRASRPVTNTVCAILYSRSFLSTLVDALDSLPAAPIVPIDWRLNLALMEIARLRPHDLGACLFVEPAPIVQMSMQPAAILPA